MTLHLTLLTRAVCLLAWLPAAAFSDTSVATAVTIETVPVGNPGNPADTRYDPYGVGSVPHSYRIGKYEVTNSQYVEFLNSVDPTGANTRALYNTSMSSNARGGIIRNSAAADGLKYEIKPGREQNPVIFVSLRDAARFTNWLHNGQGNGDTESGAYTFSGDQPMGQGSFTRNSGAKWWIPSLDEFYKAAYHKNDGATANYWDSPFSSDAIPDSDQPPGNDAPIPANTANFFKDDSLANGYNDGFAVTGLPGFNYDTQNTLTNVGAYTLSRSPYGTFDQGGNVWEWVDTYFRRDIIGGGWNSRSADPLLASYGTIANAFESQADLGFRVATIPEASGRPINIAVDFDSYQDLPPGERTITTQPEFLSWNASEFSPNTKVTHFFEEGVEFELRGFRPVTGGLGAPNNVGSRNRNYGDGGSDDDLLQDFAFAEGGPGAFLYLSLTGLPVGTYRMSSWHYDAFWGAGISMQIEVGDKQGSMIAAATAVVIDHFSLGSSPQVFEFQVTSPNVVKEIVFRSDSLHNHTRLNGFTLVAIPEPSTIMALVGPTLVLIGKRRSI